MAKFDMKFDEDVLGTLLNCDFEDIAKEALNKCASPLTESVQTSLTRSAGRGYATGTMVSSVKPTKATKAKTDAYILVVRPTGKDEKGVRNMAKAAYLEYGTTNQGARPWLTNSVRNVEGKCTDIMQSVYNKKVGAD